MADANHRTVGQSSTPFDEGIINGVGVGPRADMTLLIGISSEISALANSMLSVRTMDYDDAPALRASVVRLLDLSDLLCRVAEGEDTSEVLQRLRGVAQ